MLERLVGRVFPEQQKAFVGDPDAASIPELDEPSLPLPQKLLGDELSSRLNNSSGRGFEAQLQDDASFVALCRDWARPGAAMENLTIISL
eukprot:s1090_g6.t1